MSADLAPKPCPVCDAVMTEKHCASTTCSWQRCTACSIDVDTRLGLWKAGGR